MFNLVLLFILRRKSSHLRRAIFGPQRWPT